MFVLLKARQWRSAVGESFIHAVAGVDFPKSDCLSFFLSFFLSCLRQIKSQDCFAAEDVDAIEASWGMLVISASKVSCVQLKEACVWRTRSL